MVISWLPSGNVVSLSPLTLVLIGMLILLDRENLNENMCPYHVILGFFLTLVLQLFTLICAIVASHQTRIWKAQCTKSS